MMIDSIVALAAAALAFLTVSLVSSTKSISRSCVFGGQIKNSYRGNLAILNVLKCDTGDYNRSANIGGIRSLYY